jgi:hypothetical protein
VRRRLALLPALLLACAPTHEVRPLGRGNAAAHVSLGGPLVAVSGLVFPVPIGSLGGGYGVSDGVDVTGEIDGTAAAFGVAHVQPGLAWHAPPPACRLVPALTLAASVHLLTNLHDTRVAPQGTVAAAWRAGRRHLVYLGADAGVVSGDPTRVLAGPFAGGQLRVGRAWALALEAKWLAPWYDVAPLAPTWISPASHGYLSVLLGVSRYFGGVR